MCAFQMASLMNGMLEITDLKTVNRKNKNCYQNKQIETKALKTIKW